MASSKAIGVPSVRELRTKASNAGIRTAVSFTRPHQYTRPSRPRAAARSRRRVAKGLLCGGPSRHPSSQAPAVEVEHGVGHANAADRIHALSKRYDHVLRAARGAVTTVRMSRLHDGMLGCVTSLRDQRSAALVKIGLSDAQRAYFYCLKELRSRYFTNHAMQHMVRQLFREGGSTLVVTPHCANVAMVKSLIACDFVRTGTIKRFGYLTWPRIPIDYLDPLRREGADGRGPKARSASRRSRRMGVVDVADPSPKPRLHCCCARSRLLRSTGDPARKNRRTG